jgi:hypothetical protein
VSSPRDQRGQAATEVLLVAIALAAALLLPWLEGESPASWLLGALLGVSRSFQRWLFLL